MRIVTTCAGKLPALATRVSYITERMIADGMPFLNPFQLYVTTGTNLIYGTGQLKPIIAGMWAVTGNTATSFYNSMLNEPFPFFLDTLPGRDGGCSILQALRGCALWYASAICQLRRQQRICESE